MVSRILALLVWAAVAASLAFWGLRWMARPAAVPPGTSSVALSGAVPRADVTRLLSPPATAADEPSAPSQQAMLASRLQLVGVVAPRRQGDGGIALLVVDGKPARAYKTGHAIDGDLVLQSVTQQGVQIGPAGGAAAVNLNLPLLPAAATGMLPSANGVGGAPAGMPPEGRAGGYNPSRPVPMPSRPGGGMADTPVEGAEPAPAGGPGAAIMPGDTPQQVPSRLAAAAPSTHATSSARQRWMMRRGAAQQASSPADNTL
ncbi:hypothetical protein EIP75_00970 [Aquabacterium soli]|jgi:general secretion pathway protein C|uniref:Type II secretion system protein GspC N-terminal domain-containing protein n=1 Tax=Aquabacterium soli TaxID=2493092 RepID=A0A3R8T4U8_9BURK|nr:hypothetical protein [Aquabacterium soli]RRS06198.1 hypothetical protein EIP75_00970 [Aquabacterium soli]